MLDANFDNPLARPPAPPESPMKQRKDMLWKKVSSELSQITDGGGKGIDAGIMDTVVGLNVLGITTRQSCEGHIEWGTGTPWVDVKATGPKVEELGKKARQAWETAENADREHATVDELYRVFRKAHQAGREEKAEHLKVAKKVMTHLEEFYADRQVPYDRRLVLTYGATRLESQGAAFQEGAEPGVKQQKLVEFREEMNSFTIFLKEKFSADETPIEPGEKIAKMLEEMRIKFTAERSRANPESESPPTGDNTTATV